MGLVGTNSKKNITALCLPQPVADIVAVLVIVLFGNESHMSRIGLTWISECLIMHQKVWVIWGL